MRASQRDGRERPWGSEEDTVSSRGAASRVAVERPNASTGAFSRAREALVLALVVALACALSWARLHFNDEFGPGSLLRVAGLEQPGAATPFQYRVLTPWLVRGLHESVLTGVGPLVIFRWLDVLAIAAAWLATRALARSVLGPSLANGAAFLLLALLPFHFVFSREYPFWYAWDMTSIAVFATGLWLMQRRSWAAYYALFALGTLNRETTCFLTLVLLGTEWRTMPRARLALHVGVQAALWIAIKWALREHFADARGADVAQSTWRENLDALASPASWRWFLLAFGGTWILLFVGWGRIASPWLRAALLACLPALAGLFLVGVWTELRIFGELVPLVALGVVAVLAGRAGDLSAGSRPAAR